MLPRTRPEANSGFTAERGPYGSNKFRSLPVGGMAEGASAS